MGKLEERTRLAAVLQRAGPTAADAARVASPSLELLLGNEYVFEEHHEEFLGQCRWTIRDRFDRGALNRRLAVPAGATNTSAVA